MIKVATMNSDKYNYRYGVRGVRYIIIFYNTSRLRHEKMLCSNVILLSSYRRGIKYQATYDIQFLSPRSLMKNFSNVNSMRHYHC